MLKRELNCWKKKERTYYLSDLVPGSERTEQALQKIHNARRLQCVSCGCRCVAGKNEQSEKTTRIRPEARALET